MNDNKRYYWIKLKTDFFNQETIDFLLSQKNGCEYIVLYQMLCLNTANNNGKMCSKIGEMIIPYNIEKIIRDTKYFDFDTVTIALELFKKLGLVYEENDKILKIYNFDEMVGSEVSSAKRVRKFRERKKTLQCNNDVTQEIEYRDKSIDKDINIENNNINSPAKAVQCKEIIDYLNLKANTHYRHNIKKTQSLINARFNENFTLDDFKRVIDNKTSEWKNTEMEKYLRPETLFGTKFESYLNQKKKETLEEMMERITKRNEQRTGN